MSGDNICAPLLGTDRAVEVNCCATGFDPTVFISEWGAEAQAFGWTARDGLHPVPERPAPNHSRLARVDNMGLIWLLRGRPVIVLTSTEAIMRCRSGATLTFYRRTEPALAEIANDAPATETVNVIQVVKPTLETVQVVEHAPETAEISEGATA